MTDLFESQFKQDLQRNAPLADPRTRPAFGASVRGKNEIYDRFI
jgi:hypothetical protein